MILFRPAGGADWPAFRRLLAAHDLPLDGVPDHLDLAFVATDGERVVGTAGVEACGADGLLRSVAVAETHRRQAVGRRLVALACERARAAGMHRLYLLTTTAPAFFERLGFRRVARSRVPLAVQNTREFALLCPGTALVLMSPMTPIPDE